MNSIRQLISEKGKIGYIFAWAIGIPIPVLVVIFLLRGCD